VDLGAIAHEVAREQGVVLATRPIRLDVEVQDPVVVWADARRVRQIVQNLVGNAIKFTQRGGVVVRAWHDQATACLSVRDTGPGIGEKEQQLIFEEYKQTPEEKTKKRGSGLGLAIARRLVMLHGGTITLESALGKGSTFTVRLPKRHHEAAP
jgi:signal transduction histidine kinase